MGSTARAAVGRPRRWLAISLGLCALTVLAGCGENVTAVRATSPAVGEPLVISSASASMPPSGGQTTHAHGSATSRPATTTSGSPSTSTPTDLRSGSAPGTASHATNPSSGSAPGTASHATDPSSGSVPGTTSPTTQSSTSAPPSTAGTAACVTSAAQFNCGPFVYPQIQGTSSNPTVGNNVWNPISGWQQTLYANNPGNWSIVSNMPAGNTAVASYASSSAQFNNEPLSDFKGLSSSFSETMNATSQTSAWAMYDVWLTNSGKANEIMIQHDFANNGPCGPDATATFDGQSWNMCNFGSAIAWKLPGSEQSGSVDILAMLTWLENNGYISKSTELSAIGYGWEVASTGGHPETFTVSSYSITTS